MHFTTPGTVPGIHVASIRHYTWMASSADKFAEACTSQMCCGFARTGYPNLNARLIQEPLFSLGSKPFDCIKA